MPEGTKTRPRKRPQPLQRQRQTELDFIFRLSEAVASAKGIDEIYQEALEGLEKAFGIDRSAILLFDGHGVLRFKAWHRLSENYRREAEGHCPWSTEASDPKPLVIPDVRTDLSLGALQNAVLKEGILAMAFIPLLFKKQLLGKFTIYYNGPHHFSEEQIAVSQTIARHLSYAIYQKRSEESLRHSLQEKELLLQEIHHRVRNNLQVISSLLHIESNGVKDPEARKKLQDSLTRVQTMALIHDELYRSSNLQKIDFADYIERLVRNLIALYSSGDSEIRSSIEVRRCALDIDSALRLGMIISEIVSNSLEHAFQDPARSAEIFIKMENANTIVVGDNGTGRSREMDWRALESGLKIVRLLVEQIHGQIERSIDQGTVYRITIPADRIEAP